MNDGCITVHPIVVDVTSTHQEIEVECHGIVVDVLRESNITIEGRTACQSLIITSNNQLTFDLLYAIADPDKSRLYLNGQKLIFGVDYSINASVLNYFGVALETTDYLELYF